MQTPNELLPDGLQMDLLWTNASPTSAFASQSIYMDTSRYKMLFIEIAYDTLNRNFNTVLVIPRKYIRITSLVMGTPSEWERRDFTCEDDKVIVSTAYKSENGSYGENNSVSIPLNIWGIK